MGATGCARGDLVMDILAGGGNTGAASAQSELRQQQAQFDERLYRCPCFPQLHAHARSRAEHPRGHDDDDARGRFDVHDLTAGALLAVLTPDALPVQRVPSVEDLEILRDMRRMTQ